MWQENFTGDYITYNVDWEKERMQLRQASPTFNGLLDKEPVPITPIVYLAENYYRPKAPEACCRILVELYYDGKTGTLRIHPTDDFQSVVAVPHALLRELLRELLTLRETEAAILLFEGRTIRYIASQMKIAEGTVKRMIYNIYQKMHLASQVELIRDIYARLAQHVQLTSIQAAGDGQET